MDLLTSSSSSFHLHPVRFQQREGCSLLGCVEGKVSLLDHSQTKYSSRPESLGQGQVLMTHEQGAGLDPVFHAGPLEDEIGKGFGAIPRSDSVSPAPEC